MTRITRRSVRSACGIVFVAFLFVQPARADHPGEVKFDPANAFGSPESPIEVAPAETYRAAEPPPPPHPRDSMRPRLAA
ncbi:MAG: hypothetical protein M3331_03105 [Actinomycetota bacterium]|nr:hypothetical protein [Actinomycetota bacterium]